MLGSPTALDLPCLGGLALDRDVVVHCQVEHHRVAHRPGSGAGRRPAKAGRDHGRGGHRRQPGNVGHAVHVRCPEQDGTAHVEVRGARLLPAPRRQAGGRARGARGAAARHRRPGPGPRAVAELGPEGAGRQPQGQGCALHAELQRLAALQGEAGAGVLGQLLPEPVRVPAGPVPPLARGTVLAPPRGPLPRLPPAHGDLRPEAGLHPVHYRPEVRPAVAAQLRPVLAGQPGKPDGHAAERVQL
mmetsp:Transcript_124646/g.388107  ORF Transcript_124646/g.388107 Transcript_124646/m.388107 type:complete len:244 (-) Transcript_124646:327-1058(-)